MIKTLGKTVVSEVKKVELHLDETILSKLPHIQIGLIRYQGATVSESPKMLKGRIELFLEQLKTEYEPQEIGNIPQIGYFRQCFKALGISPSKYRPSSEALLRRVLQGKPFPFIHSAADVNNFVSLYHLMPCGLYDADQLSGERLVMRLGRPGEAYISLAGKETSAEGKWITADNAGPFGSPIIDADRTKTSLNSTHMLHILYLPDPLKDGQDAHSLLQSVADLFIQMNGGEVLDLKVMKQSSA
ncbi:DNA/RNA-binding domain of Phe-tRNA-synthetase-like protein [Caldalkalibacillus uzonensis]|uniref:DNA/RNA-binding domain of Phe-tRNA-synthetase-like protein n=1 Tax=Caldalkalibacillus uzonensis TaxID=353224 RepID=A0ABU0CXD0_9BACI|nr:phenylalanine--tRNA ligase beta subunit-related protein [Caldalkalibacillus uzonensis]MDQ0340714.1 DNA/RNA-binding domain of Phe-tRNA-synthetase-like protein [Caldalkalibacillus uzonensis]